MQHPEQGCRKLRAHPTFNRSPVSEGTVYSGAYFITHVQNSHVFIHRSSLCSCSSATCSLAQHVRRQVRIHPYEQLCAACGIMRMYARAARAVAPPTTMKPGTLCPLTGAACAAAPQRQHSEAGFARRQVRIHPHESALLCLCGFTRAYSGAACAAAPQRQQNLVHSARRQVCLYDVLRT